MSAAKKLVKQFSKENVERIKIGFTDIDGVMRGKYISLDKFTHIVESASGFCDCVFGWDINDQLYDNAKFTGWHTAFPDAKYRILPETLRYLPDEPNTPFFLLEFVGDDDKSASAICPRGLLHRMVARLNELGYGARLAFEYEFFVFDETPHSIRDKNYHDLTPLTPGNCGYSVLRNSVESDLFHAFMDYCADMDMPLEGLHCETGPGVWEAALAHDDALSAVDKAALFKTFSKVFFQKRDYIATFMSKWSMHYPGQSGHVHFSLYDLKSNKNVFFDKSKTHTMSDIMLLALGGLQQYTSEFLPLFAPTINSYTRLVKGAWAPTTASWGVENRTTGYRIIHGTEHIQRIECRLGPADANPYLIASAMLAATILGLEQQLQPTAALVGNAYEQEDKLPENLQLACNLKDATNKLSKSSSAREMLGDAFVSHFVSTREWEVREYERHVNDWQLKRYFELI
jgi:glutamine synthetase